jgi:hypothetical protein
MSWPVHETIKILRARTARVAAPNPGKVHRIAGDVDATASVEPASIVASSHPNCATAKSDPRCRTLAGAAYIAQAARPNRDRRSTDQGNLIMQTYASLPAILIGLKARSARLQRTAGIVAIASSLVAWTQPVASQELLDRTTGETPRNLVLAQGEVSASPRMPASPTESFFFGWLEFDFTPDENGNIPGFGKLEPSLPHQHEGTGPLGISQNFQGR